MKNQILTLMLGAAVFATSPAFAVDEEEIEKEVPPIHFTKKKRVEDSRNITTVKNIPADILGEMSKFLSPSDVLSFQLSGKEVQFAFPKMMAASLNTHPTIFKISHTINEPQNGLRSYFTRGLKQIFWETDTGAVQDKSKITEFKTKYPSALIELEVHDTTLSQLQKILSSYTNIKGLKLTNSEYSFDTFSSDIYPDDKFLELLTKSPNCSSLESLFIQKPDHFTSQGAEFMIKLPSLNHLHFDSYHVVPEFLNVLRQKQPEIKLTYRELTSDERKGLTSDLDQVMMVALERLAVKSGSEKAMHLLAALHFGGSNNTNPPRDDESSGSENKD